MAGPPSYTSDLNDITDAESVAAGWAELTGHLGGGAATDEGDYYIQNTQCVSQSTGNKTGTACGLEYDYGSDMSASFASGDVFFVWHIYLAANAIETWSNGGIRFGVGSSAGNVNYWNSVGNDFGRNPYGGWMNMAVDPTFTADSTDGTPVAATYQFFASLPNIVSAVSKGNPHGCDAIRWGRGKLFVVSGESGNFATFSGLAGVNDEIAKRWGLFSLQSGSYLWKGLMSIGSVGSGVNFTDANRAIFVDSCPRTYTDFNKVEIRNTSSVVNWTNVSFTALPGPNDTASLTPGILEVIDDADVNIDGCSFQDMADFTFLSNSSVIGSTFKTCSGIDSGGGVFTGTNVLTPNVDADGYGLYWNSSTNPDGYLDDMVFSKGDSAHHAITFGTSAAETITLRGITFTDFSATDGQNDSVIHILRTTGTTTIQAVETTGTVSYKSEGATVNVTQGVVTQITAKDSVTAVALSGVKVWVEVADDANFPYQDPVTVSGSGTTAIVNHASHGLSTGNKVVIRGADQDVYNGGYTISGIDAGSYSYQTNETITVSPATGTITSTMVIINGLTDGDGVISDQRTYSADQPIVGWCRSGSESPYYQQSPISDTIDSATGVSITNLLVSDE
jgi:hypothetical protein